MAGATGLEPATSAVTGQRSNQLSYAPAKNGSQNVCQLPMNRQQVCDVFSKKRTRLLEAHGREAEKPYIVFVLLRKDHAQCHSWTVFHLMTKKIQITTTLPLQKLLKTPSQTRYKKKECLIREYKGGIV